MTEKYNPIQPVSEHEIPDIAGFPPVSQRVPQEVDPYKPVSELDIPRVTYQGNDRCNLGCPGCYVGDWLRPDGKERTANTSTLVDLDTYESHLDALGPQLKEVYALGAELTAAPDHSKEIIRRAAERDLAVMAITNGARKPAVVDRTLLEGLETGSIYRLVVSLDSMEPEVNDSLRGRRGACEATLETIKRYAERGFPLKIQMTVWPRNYGTILRSVQTLYEDYGVRGFSFHCGSLEGTDGRTDLKDEVGGALDPLAWRALTDRLAEFNEEHYDDLDHFAFPYIYFTEEELRQGVIGEPDLTDKFLNHTQEIENGNIKPLPFNACPGIGVPQIYLFANDRTSIGEGRVSACNIDSIANGRFVAEYDSEKKEFSTVQDPQQNQVNGMVNSPNMCPGVTAMTDGMNGTGSDRFETDEGDLFHACRYISNNQMPPGPKKFPKELHEQWVDRYSTLSSRP